MRRQWGTAVFTVCLSAGAAWSDGPSTPRSSETGSLPAVTIPSWKGTQSGNADPVWVASPGVQLPGKTQPPVVPPVPVPAPGGPIPPPRPLNPTESQPLPVPRQSDPEPKKIPSAETIPQPPKKLTTELKKPEPKPAHLVPLRSNPAAEDCPPWAAPAAVLEPHPHGVVNTGVPASRHGTFGSPDLRLSRDYHFLDVFGAGLFGSVFSNDPGVMVLDEGPPTDSANLETDYLLMWMNRSHIPALLTTGPAASLGFLGAPGTTALLGPGNFGPQGPLSGLKIRGGGWFDDRWPGHGINGSFFFLGPGSHTYTTSSNQFPVLTRPFFAPNAAILPTGALPGEFGEQIAFPQQAEGVFQAELSSFLWGADVNLRSCIYRTCMARAEWFAGYRHVNLRETLTMAEFLVAGPNNPQSPVGTRTFVEDRFGTRNQFHGGQIGYAVGRQQGRFDYDFRASVALGVSHQEVDISGFQVRELPGVAPVTFNGGLLAVGPNVGTYRRNEFAVVPELTFNLGYMITPATRIHIGYNFLYWSNVVRPGEQIDRVVDLTFIPNAPMTTRAANRPVPTFQQSDLWAQGLQFGFETRW